MAKQVTTLFIRETELSLLVVRGNTIKKWASLPLEPGLVKEGLIVDEAQVADRVKELFALEKAGTKKVIVGLSGINSLYRMITLPELPAAILPEAVRREAARVIPVPLDEVYLSYQSLPAPPGEKRIFLVTFPRQVADALLRTLRQAGIKPYITDIAPLALSRIPDEPRSIIVHARLGHLGIMIVADRAPQVIRNLSLPSEAESLAEKMPFIGEELTRTIAFYNASHQDKPLNATVPVFVCGELADAPQTWGALGADRFGYSVSPLPSPVKFPEAFNPNAFMVNIGLVLKELQVEQEGSNFSLVNFNALPEAYRPKGPPVAKIVVSAAAAVGLALLAFGMVSIQESRADITEWRSQLIGAERDNLDQQQQITTRREQIAGAKAGIASVGAEIGQTNAVAAAANAMLIDLQSKREDVAGDLLAIISPPPEVPEVMVTAVSHGGDRVTLSGTAPLTDLYEYARHLRGSGRFTSVIVSSIAWVGEDGEAMLFSFTIHLVN